jgi:hypothetical protein
MFSPLKTTVPDFGFTMPEIARNVVDFPAPFAPTSVTIAPSGTLNEMPCSAAMEP